MFEKILIANRGEVALRIHRACKEMGIKTVAVHSKADENAMHVRLADEAICIGPSKPSESYLNKMAIISAAHITGADAIHPGYGFLSENADFAQMVTKHGITFIGPSPEHIKIMGDKILAKEKAKEIGLPLIPGSGALKDVKEAVKWANKIGYPVILKAKNGGGGKGMKIIHSEKEMEQAFATARLEAKSYFGDDTLFLEKYLQNPRHIEIQIIADRDGNVVSLGERDCSIQRNNQKILEETPSPAINAQERQKLCELTRNAIQNLGYYSAGTVEFLYEDGQFYFLEMNTRLQVEHPVTEAISDIDIVREQIRIASGSTLGYSQADVGLHGHAIECRINAENSETFLPSPGKIKEWHAPGGLGVRVDSGIYSGYDVPPYYDSLIAKLVVSGRSRNACLMRLRRALEEFVIDGIDTTIPLHQKIISQAEFIDGQYDTSWLENFLKN